jgi:serine protease inhibitor
MPQSQDAWEAIGQMAIVTTLWAAVDLPIASRYTALARSWPGGGVRTVDFAGDPDRARETINADVEQTTHGLIRDLLGPPHPTAQTRAILVNALWLKAAWCKAFAPEATRDLPFRASSGTRSVPTMHQEMPMPYAARSGWQVVSFPAGGDVVVDILLPDRDLAEAEAVLDAPMLADLVAATRAVQVALWLPRFRVEGSWGSLREPLAALGIRTLFTDTADLSGMTDSAEALMVSAAVHKAVLTIDEAGLEGAAATGEWIAMMRPPPPPPPIPVRVDRPFLVLVRHHTTGAIYFIGRVTEP